jgi:predicted nucleic acid binding AN1-type Zn finger protein
MEFDHVGSHCSLKTCHQRDFLPFVCDVCKGHYCLDHRTYASHNCIGGSNKDMTSIGCPICGETIKFSQSQNIDELWTIHFENECSQTAKQTKKVDKCVSSSCQVRLGPSNRFQCPKCNELVCLSHRRPEDHHCRLVMQGSSVKKSKVRTSSSIPKNVNADKVTNPRPLPNEAFLERFSKPSTGAASKTSPPPIQPTSAYRDDNSCPVCLEVFQDAIQLIEHVESRHSETPPQPIRQSDQKCTVH